MLTRRELLAVGTPAAALAARHGRQGPARDHLNQILRHLAKRRYYVHAPVGTCVAVWEGALKNYGPSLSDDYGGRLVAAWLDR